MLAKLELVHLCNIRYFWVFLTTNVLYGVAFERTTGECTTVPSAKATYKSQSFKRLKGMICTYRLIKVLTPFTIPLVLLTITWET